MEEERNNGGNGDPQSMPGDVAEETDESVVTGEPLAARGEGEGGTRKRRTAARPKRGGRNVAARRGAGQTVRKTGTGVKKKIPREAKKPRRRKEREVDTAGIARAGVRRSAKGRGRTAAARRPRVKIGRRQPARRKANRGTVPRRRR